MGETIEHRLTPEQRYRMDGVFDADSYNDDLSSYPDYFDENGWPLFGDYDPYTLKHPITGVSWLDAPRIPQEADAGTEYERWFQIAEEFNSGFFEVLLRMRELSNKLGARYVSGPPVVRETLVLIRSELLPRLKELIEHRENSIELTLLWGKFRQLAEKLSVSVDAAGVRHARAISGSSKSKDAQMKFYLHWRRFYEEEKGWSARRANGAFVALVRGIIRGERTAPPGFSIEWWKNAYGEGDRGIPDSFRRIPSDRANRLLTSAPEEKPQIPPLDDAAYPLARCGNNRGP